MPSENANTLSVADKAELIQNVKGHATSLSAKGVITKLFTLAHAKPRIYTSDIYATVVVTRKNAGEGAGLIEETRIQIEHTSDEELKSNKHGNVEAFQMDTKKKILGVRVLVQFDDTCDNIVGLSRAWINSLVIRTFETNHAELFKAHDVAAFLIIPITLFAPDEEYSLGAAINQIQWAVVQASAANVMPANGPNLVAVASFLGSPRLAGWTDIIVNKHPMPADAKGFVDQLSWPLSFFEGSPQISSSPKAILGHTWKILSSNDP